MQICKFVHVWKYARMQGCKYASMQVCKDASMQVCRYAGMHASMLFCKDASMPETANDSLRYFEIARDSPKYQIFVQKGPG